MGWLRRAWLRGVSAISWRLPGWPRRLLQAFSLAEQGSFHDMIAAAEQTDDRRMRRRYLEHALDESRHCGLFRQRVEALTTRPDDREQAATVEANLLTEHGIVGGQTLFERLGELEFLAFVYIAERDAVEQFHVYLDDALPDPDTRDMLRDILRDEHFHVSYSRAALERLRTQGRGREVQAALWRVQWRRLKAGWLRISRDLGRVVTSMWMVLLYLIAFPPFALLARQEAGGWQPPTVDPRSRQRAARSLA
jgi:rubrerythrin